ncbi:hypothetical protein ACFQ48_12515 [Hymenobacter caeli]|uniref:WD40 repeat domain-containing protein n=1 Tax=Hymenobacter caeli TaxID=2735894 RepID=A0ABX2FMW9_9BACT|nr:hypothetical protein [Hymenobacter caeli]NRT18507.1 hypothetical protein [Hymenobacter caeli]
MSYRNYWALLTVAGLMATAPAQAQKVKSVPFSYQPEQGADRYDSRVPIKTLPLADGSGFVILAHQATSGYAVECYDQALKKQWAAALPVAPGETVEAFGLGPEQAWVVLHHADEGGQNLTVHPVALRSGQLGPPVVLVAASAHDRRPGVAISPDGTHLLAFAYQNREEQIRALDATLFDQKLTKVLSRTYDFRATRDFFSPNVLVANDGAQLVTMLSEGMSKLAVRRYPATPDLPTQATPVPVLGVPVGGMFGGRTIRIRDARFKLLPDGQLYAAALVADYDSGELTGLKVVRFDFDKNDIKLSDEVPFNAAYLAAVGLATGAPAPKRLEDIYLADLLLTPEKNLVVLAERHYEEGGPELPVHAREIHAFGYNSFARPSWHKLVAKDQTAPAVDSYTGIGFRAAVFGEEIQLVSLEALAGKSDLYLRRLQAVGGAVSDPQRLKLNVADDQQLAYVKDFTAWLTPKTIIGISRPNKRSAALQLNRVELK